MFKTCLTLLNIKNKCGTLKNNLIFNGVLPRHIFLGTGEHKKNAGGFSVPVRLSPIWFLAPQVVSSPATTELLASVGSAALNGSLMFCGSIRDLLGCNLQLLGVCV